jgi:outer membrane protein assembly factor BamE (lipoprotein component of BamABCDE complex)
MRKSVWIIALLVVVSILGCSRSYGTKIDSEKLLTIKNGETTKAQVVSLLGQPNQKSMMDNKEIYQYMYTSISHNPFNPFSGGSTENQSAVISFDERGIVESVSSSSGGF